MIVEGFERLTIKHHITTTLQFIILEDIQPAEQPIHNQPSRLPAPGKLISLKFVIPIIARRPSYIGNQHATHSTSLVLPARLRFWYQSPKCHRPPSGSGSRSQSYPSDSQATKAPCQGPLSGRLLFWHSSCPSVALSISTSLSTLGCRKPPSSRIPDADRPCLLSVYSKNILVAYDPGPRNLWCQAPTSRYARRGTHLWKNVEKVERTMDLGSRSRL